MEDLKNYIWKHEAIVSALLLVLMASVHLPWHLYSPLTMLLAPLIVIFREDIYVKKEFKFLFILFFIYLFLFTVLSQDIGKSLVAYFKVMKGTLFFFFSVLFCLFARNAKNITMHSAILFFIAACNFLFKNKHIVGNGYYYSYSHYLHPNPAAFSFFSIICLSLILLAISKTHLEKALNIATVLCGTALIVITNSRSIWLGAILSAILLALSSNMIKNKIKLLILSIATSSAFLLFFVFNQKNPIESLFIRGTVWKAIYSETMASHPLVGFGFNTYKKFFNDLMPLAIMPHSSAMEIFMSSGIIGSLMMICILAILSVTIFKIIKNVSGKNNISIVTLSCYAFVALMISSLLDFRFFDYKFMATVMTFIGFLNFGGTQTFSTCPVARQDRELLGARDRHASIPSAAHLEK